MKLSPNDLLTKEAHPSNFKGKQRSQRYRIFGTGCETILAFNGLGCDSSLYEEFVSFFAKSYRIIIFENRGMGEFSNDLENYEMSTLLEDAIDSLELIDGKMQASNLRYHVLGISMGGFLAQLFTLRFKNNIKSLSLWCTQGPYANGFSKVNAIKDEDYEKLKTMDKALIAKLSILGTVGVGTRSNPKLLEKFIQWKLSSLCNVDELQKQAAAAEKFLHHAFPYEKISAPCFVMAGENDRVVNIQNSFKLAALLNAKCETLAGLDHLFFKEQAEQVHRIQQKFFTAHA